jgi:exosortase B
MSAASGARSPGASQSTFDPVALAAIATGFAALALPVLWDWWSGLWADETQGHEGLIVAISALLLLRQRGRLASLTIGAPAAGAAVLVVGLLLYVAGRAEESLRLQLGSIIVVLAGVIVSVKGRAGLRAAWFPLFFMLFALPLPFSFVLAVTAPMKTAVSMTATHMLDLLGYPVGRAGVVITVGQYQLLVNEACAGLQTMFVLEAMGLLYASLVDRASMLRNVLLAALVVPIAFVANVVRVFVLCLITYHFGDAAGQGFLHGFAGLVLFTVALALIVGVDHALDRGLRLQRSGP